MKETKWFVYIVRCNDDTLYTGVTNDLNRRIKQHNDGTGAIYTKCRRPVTLLVSFEFDDKRQAFKEEYRVKRLTRKEKIKLITNK